MAERVEVSRVRGAREEAVRDRAGGADVLASLVGLFTAMGVLVFITALIAAGRGDIDFQLNMINADGSLDEASLVGTAVALVVVFFAFLVGGYAAGRMARYDGGLNGLLTGLWMVLLVAIFGALGAWFGEEYNAFAEFDMPNWVAQLDVDDLTTEAVVAVVIGVAVMLLGGFLGGWMGEAYHRRVDAALLDAGASRRVSTTDRID